MNTIGNRITCDPSVFWQRVRDKRKNRQQNTEFLYENKLVEVQEDVNTSAHYFCPIFHNPSEN